MNYLDIIVVAVSFFGTTSGKFPNISSIRLLRWFHDPTKKSGNTEETPSPLVNWTIHIYNYKVKVPIT